MKPTTHRDGTHGRFDYPRRDSHFAHRLTRLLTKSCAAQEIGPESCWLLTVVAHQEDAKRYSGPVTFYNSQLMPLCGFSSEGRLIRARDRAVSAGWLHYEAGGKRRPGRYWCSVPRQYAGLSDGAVDEGNGSALASNLQAETKGKRRESDGQLKEERSANGGPSTLFPNPIPTPEREGTSADADARPVELIDAVEAELIRRWNSVAGVCHVRGRLSKKRRQTLADRLKEPTFRDGWREAIDRVAESSFLSGHNDRGWRADVEWFLQRDKVTRLLEGFYADRPNGQHAGLQAFLTQGDKP